MRQELNLSGLSFQFFFIGILAILVQVITVFSCVSNKNDDQNDLGQFFKLFYDLILHHRWYHLGVVINFADHSFYFSVVGSSLMQHLKILKACSCFAITFLGASGTQCKMGCSSPCVWRHWHHPEDTCRVGLRKVVKQRQKTLSTFYQLNKNTLK